ncbi:MAG: nicotinate (nicotinamide) nucleotide adenylyltransferase [Bacteroidota bacterium]
MRVGLFFGSFNPVHVGHMVLANYMVSFTDMEQLWFVVSPHNPLKEKTSLLNQNQRLHMVNLAIGENATNIKSSNIEFGLTQPSYTVNTLAHLKEKYPQHEFSLIMGEDNLQSFTKWKNYEEILKNHVIYVYPRPNSGASELKDHKNVIMTEAPLMDISSTMIRQAIKDKKDMSFFVPPAVWEYVDEMNFYKK